MTIYIHTQISHVTHDLKQLTQDLGHQAESGGLTCCCLHIRWMHWPAIRYQMFAGHPQKVPSCWSQSPDHSPLDIKKCPQLPTMINGLVAKPTHHFLNCRNNTIKYYHPITYVKVESRFNFYLLFYHSTQNCVVNKFETCSDSIRLVIS